MTDISVKPVDSDVTFGDVESGSLFFWNGRTCLKSTVYRADVRYNVVLIDGCECVILKGSEPVRKVKRVQAFFE